MDPYTDAFGYLFGERLNYEVLLLADADGNQYMNLRARPWKNSPMDGYMLLVGGYTFDDLLIDVAEAHQQGRWVKLDWTRRHLPEKDPPRPLSSLPYQPARSELESHSEPISIKRRYDNTRMKPDGA